MKQKVKKRPLQRMFTPSGGSISRIAAQLPLERDGATPDLTETKAIPPGTVLIAQGCRVRKVQVIQRGLVMLVRRDAAGSEVLVGVRSDGWYAGAISVILDRPSAYSVKTVTHCRTTQIAANQLVLALTQNPTMMRHFTLALCHEITSQARKELRLSRQAEGSPCLQTREHALPQGVDALPLFDQSELTQLLSISPDHLTRLIYELHATPKA